MTYGVITKNIFNKSLTLALRLDLKKFHERIPVTRYLQKCDDHKAHSDFEL